MNSKKQEPDWVSRDEDEEVEKTEPDVVGEQSDPAGSNTDPEAVENKTTADQRRKWNLGEDDEKGESEELDVDKALRRQQQEHLRDE